MRDVAKSGGSPHKDDSLLLRIEMPLRDAIFRLSSNYGNEADPRSPRGTRARVPARRLPRLGPSRAKRLAGGPNCHAARGAPVISLVPFEGAGSCATRHQPPGGPFRLLLRELRNDERPAGLSHGELLRRRSLLADGLVFDVEGASIMKRTSPAESKRRLRLRDRTCHRAVP